MPRHKPKKGPLKESKLANAKVLQGKITIANLQDHCPKTSQEADPDLDLSQTRSIDKISSILEDNHITKATLQSETAGLYDELDSFRLKWKRELEGVKSQQSKVGNSGDLGPSTDSRPAREKASSSETGKLNSSAKEENQENEGPDTDKSSQQRAESDLKSQDQTYAKAKKLFLQAVEFERDDMHHESIKYYKQAMHLCPNIERQIYREQSEVSAREAEKQKVASLVNNSEEKTPTEINPIPLYERIQLAHCNDDHDDRLIYCKPHSKLKPGTLHLSDLPQELIMHIIYHVVGQELDLASLERLGLVCRGFYLLSRDSSIWRSICFVNWGDKTTNDPSNIDINLGSYCDNASKQINWRRMYIERPRVNFDGIYISRTRYIRQGETGFQDITYRPFHVIRYYRYVRFFPDKRVIILMTNEEPDKIIPIFRNAQYATQFSPELSTLEGVYEFVNGNQIHIVADKDCRPTKTSLSLRAQRRQSQQYNNWSRQTPLSQKFNMKFELATVDSKPFRNNVLRWRDYTILSRLEFGQEITNFDLSSDTFPSLQFHRVRICNMKSTEPLAHH